jgi:hypothetical protein
MTSLRPDVKPPIAPPRALPRVPVMMSILPITLQCSWVPRPVLPMKPEACDSSIMVSAPYFSARRDDLVELGDGAVHREGAVGDDDLVALAGFGGGLQLDFQVGHVVVGVAVARGLAQADAVDDRGVVQGVRDDGVVLVEQRLEHAAVGVEGRRVQDRVFGAEEFGQLACSSSLCTVWVPQMKRTEDRP